MKTIDINQLPEISGGENHSMSNTGGSDGGRDAAGCRSDAASGFGIGATVGAAIGLAGGPAVSALGAMAVGLAGGAVAISNSPACQGSGGGGSSRVICTHFFRKGQLPQNIWRADMEFTFKNLSQTTVRGYHVWAIPYVRLMRKSPLAEKIMRPLAIWRAEELAFKMGVLEKGNWKGKVVRAICEPICFTIGLFAKEQNWESLWTQAPKATPLVENTPAA